MTGDFLVNARLFHPLLQLLNAPLQGFVVPVYPEQPKHPKQKYRLTEQGKALLK